MEGIFETFKNSIMLMPELTTEFIVRVLLEVAILWFVTYEFLTWIRNTKAWILLKGILVLLGVTLVVYILQLNTILYIIEKAVLVFVVSLIVIFQPELRKALEQIGSNSILRKLIPINNKNIDISSNKKAYEEIAEASFKMGSKCTGALMVIQKSESLSDIDKTGILVDANLTSQLLINIFEKNTPLHDGALTIENNRVAYATCYLPLSENNTISKDLGTRHRAALGVSEQYDAVTVVVSEETGHVVVAYDGILIPMRDEHELVSYLMNRDSIDSKGKGITGNRGNDKNTSKKVK